MQSKYYTPNISEFHVGFEYERELSEYEKRSTSGSWKVETVSNVKVVTKEDSPPTLGLAGYKYRVKYLDQADIEEFFPLSICKGKDLFLNTYKFKENNGESSSVLCQKIDKWSCWMITFKDTEVTIGKVNHPDITSIHPVFIGEIKNKSELKKLLSQLGYEQK